MDCFLDLYPSFAVCFFYFRFSLFPVHLLTIVYTLISFFNLLHVVHSLLHSRSHA